MRFADQVCIVTGGGSGIGKACCKQMAKEGARVAVVDINIEHGNQTVKEISDDKGQAFFSACDVGNLDQVKATVKAVVDKWGKINVVVNNAA